MGSRLADPRQLFSSKVADYTTGRPDYPVALFDELAALSVATADTQIADVGAGTGLFTQSLLDRGWNVVAVEPNDAMRAAADAALSKYPHYRSVSGDAENTTLKDQSIDLVTAAQAFHWFDVNRTRREFLRILKPRGQVALVWNDRVLSDPLQSELDEVFTEFSGNKRSVVQAHENRASVAEFFGAGDICKFTYPHEQRLDRERLIQRMLSRSYMPDRNTPEGRRVQEVVARLFQRFMSDGFVTVRYKTVATIGRPA